MQENDLLPETDNTPSTSHYEDLKYSLIRRGIRVPAAMEDYVESLRQRAQLSDTEIETIRQEMLNVFAQVEESVPSDFDKNFESWFLRK